MTITSWIRTKIKKPSQQRPKRRSKVRHKKRREKEPRRGKRKKIEKIGFKKKRVMMLVSALELDKTHLLLAKKYKILMP